MAYGVQNEAITDGPHVQWNHIDGPLMSWAGLLHWLTWREQISIFLKRRTVDDVACKRWPHLAKLRNELNASRACAIAEQPTSCEGVNTHGKPCTKDSRREVCWEDGCQDFPGCFRRVNNKD